MILKHWRCVDKIKIVLESVLLTFSLCFLSAQHVALFLRSLFNSILLICFNKECTVDPTSDCYKVTVATEIGMRNEIFETINMSIISISYLTAFLAQNIISVKIEMLIVP